MNLNIYNTKFCLLVWQCFLVPNTINKICETCHLLTSCLDVLKYDQYLADYTLSTPTDILHLQKTSSVTDSFSMCISVCP
jgi:hypothetical protein